MDIKKLSLNPEVIIPFTGCICSLSSNPACGLLEPDRSGLWRQSSPWPLKTCFTCLHQLRLLQFSITPSVSFNSIHPTPSPELLKLPHAVYVRECSTFDRMTVAKLPRVELNTLGRQLLQRHIHSSARGTQWDSETRSRLRQPSLHPITLSLCLSLPPSMLLFATQEHLMHY